ncbi:hypothetical protein FA13DRAFT_127042 [Coprinellus micaceus]|uniref:Uncharacterized protein n=1 Tax=Coprinellus micaceus TaxID=71717 RepID=A0A4Y7TKG3_COPMI|nr:hypothetical protein FA13DRAFT_127042 [Coprinellus micaceus]
MIAFSSSRRMWRVQVSEFANTLRTGSTRLCVCVRIPPRSVHGHNQPTNPRAAWALQRPPASLNQSRHGFGAWFQVDHAVICLIWEGERLLYTNATGYAPNLDPTAFVRYKDSRKATADMSWVAASGPAQNVKLPTVWRVWSSNRPTSPLLANLPLYNCQVQ